VSEFGFTPTQNYSYRSGAHHPGVGTIVSLLSSAGPPLLQHAHLLQEMLIQGKNSSPRLSGRPMTISSDGGRPRELPAWARMPDALGVTAWTSDSRYLLCTARKKVRGRGRRRI
jgi:hypothetical protein